MQIHKHIIIFYSNCGSQLSASPGLYPPLFTWYSPLFTLMALKSTRMAKYMYRYPHENGAAFIELKDDNMSGDELFQVLGRVPGVDRVYWQTCKSDQGNHSQRKLGTPYMGAKCVCEVKDLQKGV